MTTDTQPPRIQIAPDLSLRRMAVGLWQMADQERNGAIDLDAAAAALADYARAGFDTFDMADHYGSAEIVAGRAARLLAEGGGPAPVIMTKWCPPPGPMTPDVVRDGVHRALDRLEADTVDVMQFHWWRYEHLSYLDALAELMRLKGEGLIRHIGLTNFDTAHLEMVVRNGIEIATNQVCFSLLDRRAAGEMAAACQDLGVKVLAFGTLGGGFLSDRWLGAPEPADIADWSKMKYKRFVDASGGWAAFQGLLRALDQVARRHGVSIANVATRWVLDHSHVAAVIVGARLGERQHRDDNLRTFAFDFDDQDGAAIDAALADTTPISGDCGDEYRKPPFLTASGDLSHHLDETERMYAAAPMPAVPTRLAVDSGSEWEDAAGFSRAVRDGDRILVSGTTATDPAGKCVCPGDAGGQATYIFDKIAAAIEALGGDMADVVRTRIYMADANQWQAVARQHKRVFGASPPANTLLQVGGLVGDYLVEIEAEAVVRER